jgi:hypothetical protein
MKKRVREGERRFRYRDIPATLGVGYIGGLALANICMTAATFSHNLDARKYAGSDEASRKVGAVASRLAGYPVTVACLDRIDSGKEGVTTQGKVTRYKAVDPLLRSHTLPINPRTVRLHDGYCLDIINDQATTEPLRERRDSFRSYLILIHEITHLDESREDETGTECEAIRTMPERLQNVGFSPSESARATHYAEVESYLFTTDEYHSYPCPE